MSAYYYNWNASSGWKFDWPAAEGIPYRRSKRYLRFLQVASLPPPTTCLGRWVTGVPRHTKCAAWGTRCAATCNVLLRGPRCAQHMCVALRIKECFGTLSCYREGPGVRRHVGVMSCRTRICLTKSGRNIFPLREYYSNALCTYYIIRMLLWRHIFCRIYVVYLPSSRILDSAWYDTKLLVNSEYRGSRYWFIKSLRSSESKCGEWCLRSAVESASVIRGVLMWIVSWL